MATSKHYDAIVIGAGQAGGPLASALAKAGKTTALIEREHVGGTCINVGCTPTKTMIASGRAAYLARRGPDYGVITGKVQIDMRKIRERKRAIVESFRGGSEHSLNETKGLDMIAGEAAFTGDKALTVTLTAGGEPLHLTAELIFINTGARPAIPKLDGLDQVPYLNSTTIMELDAVPEHLIMLGGGYIALEFGQLFRRLGARVTIIERGERLIPREDPEITEAVVAVLEEDGIEIIAHANAQSVKHQDEHIALTIAVNNETRVITGSHLLVAVGRTPNTDKLNPAAAGIALGKAGHITVNEKLETNVPGIYALGDVNGGPAFTHISYDDFRIIKANLLDSKTRTTADRPVPFTMFTDPQLARVGLTETEARAQGMDIKVTSMPMSYVARALEVDESRGIMKAVVDAKTDQILGYTVFGLEGGELMAVVQMAMMGKLPYTVLRDAVFAHPTLAESLNNLFGQIE